MRKGDDSDRLTSIEQLRALYGAVGGRSADKVINELDKHCEAFIALSPFVVLASQDDAKVDVSPRGGQPGFIKIDDKTGALLIPDWPGNKRIDTLQNIIKNGRFSLLFMIPNFGETLRVIGQASIHKGEAVRTAFKTNGKLPITVIKLNVETAFLHCAKAFLRSEIWQPESWPKRTALPTMGEMVKDHAKSDGPTESTEDMLKRYAKVLY